MSAPFIGPAYGPNGPELVQAMGGRGYPLERTRQGTRVVVDDYGDAVMYCRRCPNCRRWLPLTFEHFQPRTDNRAQGMQSRCSICSVTIQWLYRRRNRAEVRAKARDAYARRMSDPEYRARFLERVRINKRAWRENDPDRAREIMANAGRRYRQRVMADPRRRQAYLERQRIDRRLRLERQGSNLDDLPIAPTSDRFDDVGVNLPVAPLVAQVRRIVGDEHEESFVTALGLEGRTWRAWKSGERKSVRFDLADLVITALGLLPWDIWNPEEHPGAIEAWFPDLATEETKAA